MRISHSPPRSDLAVRETGALTPEDGSGTMATLFSALTALFASG